MRRGVNRLTSIILDIVVERAAMLVPCKLMPLRLTVCIGERVLQAVTVWYRGPAPEHGAGSEYCFNIAADSEVL